MKILAIDTSAVSASVAVCEDDFLIGEFYVNIKQTHSETLMPETSLLLDQCGIPLSEIGLFAVACGPGSFTGIRIGVAAVKGLAVAAGTPCAAVSTLEAAAMNLPFTGGIVCPVMDARRGQFYNALFEYEGESLRRLTPDRAVSGEELKNELKLLGKSAVLVGDGAQLCYNSLKNEPGIKLSPARLRFQRASGVAAAGFHAYKEEKTVPARELLPFYLRLPQAERELRERMGGMDR